MGRSLIMHVDDAPWRHGGPQEPGGPIKRGSQFLGEMERGPWILVVSGEPGRVARPHSHEQDEIIYIIEGEMKMGNKTHGPGTMIFMEHGTEYGFTAGPQGVRFLNIRPGAEGLSQIRYQDDAEKSA